MKAVETGKHQVYESHDARTRYTLTLTLSRKRERGLLGKAAA